VKVARLSPKAKLPVKASKGAAGYDLFASEAAVVPASAVRDGRVEIGHALVGTGIAISLPPGHVGRIGSRSGLSTRQNIEVGAGWIDPDYRGEVKIEMKNFSGQDFIVEEGMRIAQLFILPFASLELEEADGLPSSARGVGGFGSTGLR
jgi:dUTP pyrophosphatase